MTNEPRTPSNPVTSEVLARGLTNEIIAIMGSCPTIEEVGKEAFEKVSNAAQDTIYEILLMTIETSLSKGRSMAESGRKPSVN